MVTTVIEIDKATMPGQTSWRAMVSWPSAVQDKWWWLGRLIVRLVIVIAMLYISIMAGSAVSLMVHF